MRVDGVPEAGVDHGGAGQHDRSARDEVGVQDREAVAVVQRQGGDPDVVGAQPEVVGDGGGVGVHGPGREPDQARAAGAAGGRHQQGQVGVRGRGARSCTEARLELLAGPGRSVGVGEQHRTAGGEAGQVGDDVLQARPHRQDQRLRDVQRVPLGGGVDQPRERGVRRHPGVLDQGRPLPVAREVLGEAHASTGRGQRPEGGEGHLTRLRGASPSRRVVSLTGGAQRRAAAPAGGLDHPVLRSDISSRIPNARCRGAPC